MNNKLLNKRLKEQLYLCLKETYLMLLVKCAKKVDEGDVEWAEGYEDLEKSWEKVEKWYKDSL